MRKLVYTAKGFASTPIYTIAQEWRKQGLKVVEHLVDCYDAEAKKEVYRRGFKSKQLRFEKALGAS